MDEKEMMGFSWTGMFLVTGFSSFGFSQVLKVLDGSHSRILLIIGAISFFLGLLNWGFKKILQQYNLRKRKEV